MKKAATHTISCAILALATAFAGARAHGQDVKSPLDELHEAALDIDRDGKIDRAALVYDRETNARDLYIYLALGEEKLDLSRKPTFLKKGIATNLVLDFKASDKGSLIVTTGCGGCSNDFSTTLTIVHRGGEFLIAGYTYDWDTRSGAGTCDVNFLTGKGTIARNAAKAVPLKGRFAPVKLADWSEEKRPKGCE